MNNLQVFNNTEFGQVRTINKKNEIWFVGKDIALALGYADTDYSIRVHVDSEDKQLFKPEEIQGLKISNRGMVFINESGLYSLVLSFKLPTAKKFKHWITSEVLPSIKNHGGHYAMTEDDVYNSGFKKNNDRGYYDEEPVKSPYSGYIKYIYEKVD